MPRKNMAAVTISVTHVHHRCMNAVFTYRFGDTVNVASRMESTGEREQLNRLNLLIWINHNKIARTLFTASKIQLSTETKLLLDDIGGFITAERGLLDIKVKPNLAYEHDGWHRKTSLFFIHIRMSYH